MKEQQAFGVTFDGVVVGGDEAAFDQLIEALLDFGTPDPLVAGTRNSGELRVSIEVEAADPAAALNRAQSLVNHALDASGLRGSVTWRHVGVERVLVA